MASHQDATKIGAESARGVAGGFAACSARRLLVTGGIALILVGMLLGDLFAVFVLHQNASRISENLLAATQAVAAHRPSDVPLHFMNIGGFLENRGTKVDAHVHMIDFGYLALLLALLQPFVAFSEAARKRLAWILIFGAVLLPVGVFLIHYAGLMYSPLESIGWASIFADFGGSLVLAVAAVEMWGLWRYRRMAAEAKPADALLADRSWAGRTLLVWGTLLVLVGFFHGSYYAAFHLFENEARDTSLLTQMTAQASAGNSADADQAVQNYAALQGEKAVNVAAHAHIIEFGMLAILMAFFQPYVFLSERWKRNWVVALLLGSVVLPVFVLLELEVGLPAGGIADAGGLLVVIALAGMLTGVVRYTGSLDAGAGGVQ
ncbi:MAG: hypothetical protein WCA98_11065 [Candidatus Acidiferrales bacterium]